MKKLIILLLLGVVLFGCLQTSQTSPPSGQNSSGEISTQPVIDSPDIETPELDDVGQDIVNISGELGELDVSDEELNAIPG